VAASTHVGELRSSLAGEVITSADAGYDAARRSFNALVDRRPALIARCLGAADVAAAFDFARAHELEVAVRGGGHNPAGHCVCDGGLVIDLSLLRTVTVDGDARSPAPAAARPGWTSTRRPRPPAWSRPEGSSARPASPGSPSGAASAI